MKNPYLTKKVETIDVGNKSIAELLSEMAKTGFQGRKMGEVFEVWEEMLRKKNLTIIMGYAGSLSTTGMWKVVAWLMEKRFIDVLVSTGANVSEDILEAMGGSYYRGSPLVDDSDLLRNKVDRFYDVLADELEYRKMETLVQDFLSELDPNYTYSSREFLHIFGEKLLGMGINSIITKAYEKKIPVFSPAIADSGYGVAMVLARRNGVKIKIDHAKDLDEMTAICERGKGTGVIYIGGGVPKDFTQLATVVRTLTLGGQTEIPHDYAIQITADSPQWGGLSGCTLEEAVSWGKVAADGRKVTCYCDATIALPILAHGLGEKVKERLSVPDFSWLFGYQTAKAGTTVQH